MKSIRARLTEVARADGGLSLIEVVIAMFIFAMVSVGIAYAMVMSLSITNDSRAKQAASNVAAAEIDADRAVSDPSTIGPVVKSPVVQDGRTYYVTRTVGWGGASAGTSSQCSTGSGALIYRFVHVVVTWDGMSKAVAPVTADTYLAPSTRINANNTGVIIVSVLTAAGAGNQGVTVKAVPVVGDPTATAITSTVPATDAQGCSVILNVTPGKYVVSITEPGTINPSVDNNQSKTPSQTVTVSAQASAIAPFQFDVSGAFSVNYVATGFSGTFIRPSTLDTTFTNSYGIWPFNVAPYYLHPYATGYTAMAGVLAPSGSAASACSSVDPGAWPNGTVSGNTVASARQPLIATTAGGSATVNVPVGVITITGVAAGTYIKAVQQAPAGSNGTDDPGCASATATPSTYVLALPTGSTTWNVALPFGTWSLFKGTSSSQTTALSGTTLATAGKASSNLVTLDPRTVVSP